MSQFWNDILKIPESRWIVYGTLLIFAVLIAVYVSLFFRNMAFGANDDEDLDLLTEFRSLRDQGHLNDHEYDRLKTVVPENAKHELLRGGTTEDGRGIPAAKNFMTLDQAERMKNLAQSSVDEKEGRETDS